MATKCLLMCLTAGLALCGCGVPEQLEEGMLVSGEGLTSERRHCAIQTLAVRKGLPLPENVGLAKPECFDTFSGAIAFATAGTVQLAPETTPENFDPRVLASDPGGGGGAGTNFVIGVEYEHINHGGLSYIFYNSKTCLFYNHVVNSMPSGWNDRISSASTASYCNNSYHYEHDSLKGAMVNCDTSCSYIGDAMNDRTSSIKWTY